MLLFILMDASLQLHFSLNTDSGSCPTHAELVTVILLKRGA